VADRSANAKVCLAALKLSIPTVIDREDNKVNTAYSGWPDRLYVVGTDGKIAYAGSPGPSGFKPAEVESWLKKSVASKQ
jgi:type I thyroxine 5'-deiodinase